MPRTTHKSYGMSISSGLFHIIDAHNTIHDYAAILSFENYRFATHTTAHVDITTPAIGLCWTRKPLPMPGSDWLTARWIYHARPQAWFTQWLDANAPGWAVHPPNPDFTRSETCLFLTKRRHALAAYQQVAQLLKGAPTTIHARGQGR